MPSWLSPIAMPMHLGLVMLVYDLKSCSNIREAWALKPSSSWLDFNSSSLKFWTMIWIIFKPPHSVIAPTIANSTSGSWVSSYYILHAEIGEDYTSYYPPWAQKQGQYIYCLSNCNQNEEGTMVAGQLPEYFVHRSHLSLVSFTRQVHWELFQQATSWLKCYNIHFVSIQF